MGRGTQALAIAVIALAGCKASPPPQQLPSQALSDVEIGLREMNREFLVKCGRLDTPMPENEFGALLKDYGVVAAYAAACRKKQNQLVDYLLPLVNKAKGAPAPK